MTVKAGSWLSGRMVGWKKQMNSTLHYSYNSTNRDTGLPLTVVTQEQDSGQMYCWKYSFNCANPQSYFFWVFFLLLLFCFCILFSICDLWQNIKVSTFSLSDWDMCSSFWPSSCVGQTYLDIAFGHKKLHNNEETEAGVASAYVANHQQVKCYICKWLNKTVFLVSGIIQTFLNTIIIALLL